MVGLVAIVLFANDVPLSVKLSQIDRDRFVTAVQRDAFKIGGQVTPLINLVGTNRASELIAVLDDYSLRSDGTIVVIDEKGYLIASNDPTKSVGEDFAGRPEVRAALLGTPTSGTRSSVTLGGDLLYVAIPVLSGADVLGVVRITYPKSLVDSRVNDHRRGLAGMVAISIALAVIVAFLFARFVTQPLDNLRRTTERFADGDLTAFAQESGPPETRDLASSFNLMDAALHANSSLIQVQQNIDIRKISAWAAIGAVPTMIGGLYGMNFDYMPELEWRYGYFIVVGLLVIVSATLFRLFRKYKWL